MPSEDHEMPLELFRRRPELAVELLERLSGIKVPEDVPIYLGSETLNDVDPAEYRCDVTVLVGDPEAPQRAIVLEVQLQPKRRKRYTWLVYLATIRARHECPATLLVVCPDDKTAASCREPIDTGHPGLVLRPLVMSMNGFAAVTDPDAARRMPELAVLSALAHADGPEGREVLEALCVGLEASEQETSWMYYDYVRLRLSEAARHTLEEIVSTGTYQFESDFARELLTRGEAKGEAKAILVVLGARGLPVSDELRTQITSCSDVDQLTEWLERAATVDSVEQLFAG